MFKNLDKNSLDQTCQSVAKIDIDLAAIYNKYGCPPLWDREQSFATLIHIILEQQVSLASALSAFNKLREKVGEISPENVLELSDEELKKCYFSRQKTGYARNLAEAIVCKDLVLEDLHKLSDDEVRAELMKIKGIGIWTSDIYLMMAMLRPDIMPKGDLALHVAYKNLKKLDKRPNSDEFIEMTKVWKPIRSTAARLLWHFYLKEKKQK